MVRHSRSKEEIEMTQRRTIKPPLHVFRELTKKMMRLDVETSRYALYYDCRYKVGCVGRKADGVTTRLIIGRDMMELRRTLNRARTNAGSKRKAYRPFAEIADAILGEYLASDREVHSYRLWVIHFCQGRRGDENVGNL